MTIIGVAARSFAGADLNATDIWVALGGAMAYGGYLRSREPAPIPRSEQIES